MKPSSSAICQPTGMERTRNAGDELGQGFVMRNLSFIIQDLRFAFRQLWKNPGFTAVAVLTLALGIGANTAIFSLVNALFLRPLPFREPSRLVWITNPDLRGAGVPGMSRSANLRDWRELNQSFEDLGCYIAWTDRQRYNLTLDGEAIRVAGTMVAKKFLKVLGVSPLLGRDFLDEDGSDAVILTDKFWKRQFQGDPALIGRAITVNGKPWTILGILPPQL